MIVPLRSLARPVPRVWLLPSPAKARRRALEAAKP